MNDDQSQIFQTVAELAAQHGGVDVARIVPQSRFIEDLNYDSLTMVEFVMAAEDRFKLTVPDDAAQQLQTVGQVADYIRENSSG